MKTINPIDAFVGLIQQDMEREIGRVLAETPNIGGRLKELLLSDCLQVIRPGVAKKIMSDFKKSWQEALVETIKPAEPKQ